MMLDEFSKFYSYNMIYYTEGVGVTLIAILGMIFNILSIIVFLQPNMKSQPTNILILGLQISDLGFLVGLLFNPGLVYLFPDSDFIYSTIYFALLLLNWAKIASHYFIVLVLLERLIAITKPHWSICTMKIAYVVSILLGVISAIAGCTFMKHDVWNINFSNTILLSFHAVVVQLIPFILIVGLGIGIYFGFRKLQRTQGALVVVTAEERAILFWLLGIVIVYIVCNVFTVASFMLLWLSNRVIALLIKPWAILLLGVNSASNCIFFCAFGTKFRTELARVVNCRGGNTGENETGLETRYELEPLKEGNGNNGLAV